MAGDDDGTIRKQEEDYTTQVDDALPKAVAAATGGKLREAIDGLLPLEKKARVASDAHSTGRLLEAIVQMCFDANDWDALGEYVTLLTKRRGALKMAVTKMVQKACDMLEKTPDKETKLKLIATLRTVTAGKIHVEIERARLTMKLSKIHEADGDLVKAGDVLHELQVETYGSMDKTEKVEFILEQMRLSMANKDYTRTAILAKKISMSFFKGEDAQDLKLKFYELMVDVSVHESNYLDVCKFSRQIFDTPKIQSDLDAYCKSLEATVLFLVLAPFDNEQSDLVARVALEQKLEDVPVYQSLLQGFITEEIMPWSKVESEYGPTIKANVHFDMSTDEGKKRYDDLRRRVVEHNIRVMSNYYSFITITRLSELLDLTQDKMEEYLSNLVVKQTVYARINRPKGIVTFREPRDPTQVMQDWSSEANDLMQLVDRTSHVIQKEVVNAK